MQRQCTTSAAVIKLGPIVNKEKDIGISTIPCRQRTKDCRGVTSAGFAPLEPLTSEYYLQIYIHI